MRRLLPLLLTSLFMIAGAPAFADEAYHLHGGDELNVVVYGEKDLSQTVKVLPSGTISYPLLGEVKVAGLTPTQAADTLAKGFSRYIRKPHVTVSVAKEGTLAVLVLGNVKSPGKYELPARSRLTDAIASAGGLGITDGSFPVARMATGEGAVKQVSLQSLLHDGDTSQNVVLADEMTVYVPSPLTLNVQVLGAVDHPGNIQMAEGDRLSMAIARAGNSPGVNADLNHIVVRRTKADGTPQNFNVNLYEVLKGGDLSKDFVMEKNDLVYVPQSGGKTDKVSGTAGLLYTLRHLFLPF